MFDKFKKINYPIYDENNSLVYSKEAIDITKSFLLVSSTRLADTLSSFTYQEYQLEEYETPMVVSDKLYNTPKYYWVLFLLNNILNPFTDWMMDQETLKRYVIRKYKISNASFDNFLDLVYENKYNRKILVDLQKDYGEQYVSRSEYIALMNRYDDYVNLFDSYVLYSVHHYINLQSNQIVNDYYATQYASKKIITPEYIKPVTNWEHEYQQNDKRKIIKVLSLAELEYFVREFNAVVK